MCGIAGIYNFDGRPVAQETIDRFTDALKHRGPDGRGTWRDERCGIALGHRRLAILDLSESGRQPMAYLNQRYVITFNGEIYNFLEIRGELESYGYTFDSDSDTEVILAAYDKWGPEMLLRFNGMWAFAIWDAKERTLFLTRDRFGIKPLHYRLTPRGIYFASELKAFHHLDGYQAELDTETAYLAAGQPFRIEGSQRTLFKGVSRLQGGHSALLRNGQLTISRWWNTLDHLVDVPTTLGAQAEEFYRIFSDSVRLRMRSDVSVGTCLSGGFDSTAVACTMSDIAGGAGLGRQAADWRHAFVATFPGKLNDERPQAEEAAKYAGVRAHFLEITDADSTTNLDEILRDFEDIYISLPSPVWLLYRELRAQGVVVTLDGHGADELMGGYRGLEFSFFGQAPRWWRAPRNNIRRAQEYLAYLSHTHRSLGFWKTADKLVRAQSQWHPDFVGLKTRLRPWRRRLSGLLQGQDAERYQHEPGFGLVGESDVMPPEWGSLNTELYRIFHTTTLPTILRNFDRLSMAHGIEVRMPFMDYRLVSFIMSLPESSKIGFGQSKLVAREAMRNRMPETIRSAKLKIGFNSPMPEWLQGPLVPWIERILRIAKDRRDLPFDVESVVKTISRRGRDHSWSWANCNDVWNKIHYLWVLENFNNIK